jgi:small subunit ribosomal protein S11
MSEEENNIDTKETKSVKSAVSETDSETKAPNQQPSVESQEGVASNDKSVEKAPEKKEETAEDLLGANIEQVKVRKAKGSKNIASGICFIVATFNNTKVSFSDMNGNIISWSSSGKCNFRGSRKSTAYAAQVVTQDAGRVAMSHGMKEVLVKVKGQAWVETQLLEHYRAWASWYPRL